MNGNETDVLAVLDAYKGAVYGKDVEAMLSLYDEDVRIFDAWAEWSYDRAAWRNMVRAWFEDLGDGRVMVELDDVQLAVGGDVAVASAFVTYAGLSAQGEPLRDMQNRVTWALRRGGDGWAIIHEHTSAPADFETGKVILRRERR